MIPNEQAIRALFSEAEANDAVLDRLISNPDVLLSNIGVAVPPGSVPALRVFLNAALTGDTIATLSNWPTGRCSVCTVSAWSIAAGIVAIGAVGLTSLTATTSIVIALASWAGVLPTTALAFIASLAVSITAGVSEVAKKICEWAGLCP
jgi:hypothetical protein